MKFLIWAVVALSAAFIGLAVSMRVVSDDPAVWHVDPLTAERTGKPNDYFVAPGSVSIAQPDSDAPRLSTAPRDHLFLFDAIARNMGNTAVLAGSLDELHITYVQRSPVFGFPDYITVKAITVGDGSALVIWSRSRFGHSDLGANQQRIDMWLSSMAAP